MHFRVCVGLILGALACAQVNADTATSPTSKLGLVTQSVELPSPLRVIGAFLLVATLAVAASVALRRFLPGVLGRLKAPPSGVGVSVLARQGLAPGVHIHVVAVDTERLIVVTSRSGVAVHPLSAVSAAPSPISAADAGAAR
jgi:hypothetical protein